MYTECSSFGELSDLEWRVTRAITAVESKYIDCYLLYCVRTLRSSDLTQYRRSITLGLSIGMKVQAVPQHQFLS